MSVERALAEHRQHLDLARDADPLVVGAELVAGEVETGVVPADADPDPVADREDRRVAVARALDRDEIVLVAARHVVVVRGQGVAVGRRRRRRRPDRCSGRRSPRRGRRRCVARTRSPRCSTPRVRADRRRRLGAAVELLEEPRHESARRRRRTDRQARAARRPIARRAGTSGRVALARDRVAARLADRGADLRVGAGDAQQRDRRRGHAGMYRLTTGQRGQQLGVGIHVPVDVGVGRRHGAGRAGAGQRLPDAPVGQPDAEQPRELRVGQRVRVGARPRLGPVPLAGAGPKRIVVHGSPASAIASSIPSARRAPSGGRVRVGVRRQHLGERGDCAAAADSGFPNSVPPVATFRSTSSSRASAGVTP